MGRARCAGDLGDTGRDDYGGACAFAPAPANVAAIGITNQRETTVLWDRATGRPVAPALVWQDRRTADACAALKTAGHEAEVTRRTGLVLDPYFSATKLAWLLDSDVTLRARAERGELAFGTIDSWLVWNLTGGAAHVSDITNASRTLLLNIKTGDWDPWLLELFRIRRRCCRASWRPASRRSAAGANRGTRDSDRGIAGDQQAALFGQACFEPGMAKNTYGTGCFLLMNTGSEPQYSSHRLLTTVAWDIGERCYALEGSVFTGGAVVQCAPRRARDHRVFVRRGIPGRRRARRGRCVLVPAFTGLGSPHWDPTLAVRSWDCRVAPLAPTSRAPRSNRSRSRARNSLPRCRRTPDHPYASCASTAARRATTSFCPVPGGPARTAGGTVRRTSRPRRRRGESRRPVRRLVAIDRRHRYELAHRPPLRAGDFARCRIRAHGTLVESRRARP
jgi:hypothetical protein